MKSAALFRAITVLSVMTIFVLSEFSLWDAFTLKAQQPAADHHDWKVYTNAKYRYSICYPQDLLVPQGEPDAGDGQTFLAKDGAKLVVFANYGAEEISLKQRLDWSISDLAGKSGNVTYKVVKPDWFVVSGQTGKTVFYAKATSTRDKFKEFTLTYDSGQASVYEPVVKRLAAGCFTNTLDGR